MAFFAAVAVSDCGTPRAVHVGAGGVPQVVCAITTGLDIPVFSHVTSRLRPSWARKALLPLLARCRNCTYSHDVVWYRRWIVA